MKIIFDKKENGVFTLDTDTMQIESEGQKYETYIDYSVLRFSTKKPTGKNGKKIDGFKLLDEQKNIIENAVEEKANASIKNWVWGFGIDTNLFRITAISEEGLVNSEKAKKIERLLSKNEEKIISELRANSTARDDKFLISNDVVMKIYNQLIIEANENKEKKDAKIKAIFEKAKEAGQPQQLSMYSEDCDGSVDDCSLDNIITYAMPDGSTQTRRVHTY